MSIGGIDELHYLWDASEPGWVLVHVNSHAPSEEPRYGIYNIQTREGLIIEDVDEDREAIRQMLASNVRIIKNADELK